jgi:hypothetical protein
MSDTTNIAATLQGIREEAPIDGFIRDLEFAVFGKDGNTWERSRLEAVRVLFGRAVAFGAAAAHEREASALEAARQEIATLQAATEAQHTAWNRENDLRHDAEAQVDALTRAQADLTEQKREISYVCHDQSDRLVALTKALEAARAAIHGEYCGSQHHTQCEAVTAALAGTTKVAASGSRGESVTPKGALAPPLDAAISAERVTVDALTAALRALVNGLLHDHAKYPQLCLPEMQLRRVECLAVLLDERGSR